MRTLSPFLLALSLSACSFAIDDALDRNASDGAVLGDGDTPDPSPCITSGVS